MSPESSQAAAVADNQVLSGQVMAAPAQQPSSTISHHIVASL